MLAVKGDATDVEVGEATLSLTAILDRFWATVLLLTDVPRGELEMERKRPMQKNSVIEGFQAH